MLPQNASNRSSKINVRTRNNQFIFALAMIALQIVITVLYGIYCSTPPQLLNIGSALTVIFLVFLVVIGFGLFFGTLKNLIWTGLGFALMITALSIELYPLINALWAKAGIHSSGLFADGFSTKGFKLFLANMDSTKYQNNTLSAAVKCALAIIIAFGSVIGRIGPLQCLIMTVVGTLGYELNRSININFGQDFFGSFSIFTFGGYFGLSMGIFMAIRQRKNNVRTQGNAQLTGSQISVLTSLIGTIFIFILFPFLAFEGDQSLQTSPFHRYMTPVSIFLSMGSSLMASTAVSMLINGDNSQCIRIKDIVNAVVAGGIAAGAASFYITTPYLALIIGVFSGILQYSFDNWLQKIIYQKWGLISTHSFSIFCLQGFIGVIFAAAYNGRVTNQGMNNGFPFRANLKSYGQQFAIYFISTAFGIACGILSGIPCYFINCYRTKDLFHDKTEFRPNDGINYKIEKATAVEQKQGIPGERIPEQGIKDGNALLQSVPQIDPNPPTEYSDDQFSFDFADMLQIAIQ